MKKLAAGVIVAFLVLVTAGAVAAAVVSNKDNDTPSLDLASLVSPATVDLDVAGDRELSTLKAVAQTDEEPDAPKDGFIGISIRAVTADEDEALVGRAVVVKVFEGGPSDGVLQEGDVILAVNGEDVLGVKELIERIRATSPGEVIELTISGADAPVQITVGERDHEALGANIKRSIFKHIGPGFGLGAGMFDAALDKFVSGELVVEDEDGLRTVRGVAGTLTGVDTDGSTITVAPKDGSAAVTYEIDTGEEGTKVVSDGQTVGLDGLTVDEPIIVVTETHSSDDVEHTKLVLQGGVMGFMGGLLDKFGHLGDMESLSKVFGSGGLPGLQFEFDEDRFSFLKDGLPKSLSELKEKFGFGDDEFRFHERLGPGSHRIEVECTIEEDPNDPTKYTKQCTTTEDPPADENTQ